MNNNDFNKKRWNRKIVEYQKKSWAQRPSRFVQLTDEYIKRNSKILELGSGAGQDGLWLESREHKVTFSDIDAVAFKDISEKSLLKTRPVEFDLIETFPFRAASFDVVYAQLVLHYFDDVTMAHIVNEIERVLKPDGLLACVVNSVHDVEYIESKSKNNGLVQSGQMLKRYFTKDTLGTFLNGFEPLLFDEEGRTPKDDEVGNRNLVQYIGKKLNKY